MAYWLRSPHGQAYNKVMTKTPVSDPAQATSLAMAECIEAIARSGDRAAFARLFAHFAPRVKSYLLRQGMSDDGAEELAQETMLTVWRRAAQYDRAQAAPSTWIFTIARNKRIDLLRRESRPELDPNDPIWQTDGPAEPDAALDALEREEAVRAALNGLPPEQRALIEAVYFQDKTHRDLAEETGLPLGTVKSRIRLALDKLRKTMG